MREFERTSQAIVLDDDGVALSQTPGAAGNLTLNGVALKADNGTAAYDIGSVVLDPPRRVVITSVSDESAKTFTVYGTDRMNTVISEVVTGPNATTATTTKVFKTVTRIAVSAATTGAIKVGWGTEHVSPWVVLGNCMGHNQISYALDVTGTVNCDVEKTYRNLLREAITGDYDASVSDVITAQTADTNGVLSGPVAALRVVQNSGSGSAVLRVLPSRTA
jgi:hypothetical protein